EIRKPRLDLPFAVAAAVVFHEQRVRQRRELPCLARGRRRGRDVRDRRRGLLAAKTTQESPAALLLVLFRRRVGCGGLSQRRRPLVSARGGRVLRGRLLLRRGCSPRIGVRGRFFGLRGRRPRVRRGFFRRWRRRHPRFRGRTRSGRTRSGRTRSGCRLGGHAATGGTPPIAFLRFGFLRLRSLRRRRARGPVLRGLGTLFFGRLGFLPRRRRPAAGPVVRWCWGFLGDRWRRPFVRRRGPLRLGWRAWLRRREPGLRDGRPVLSRRQRL